MEEVDEFKYLRSVMCKHGGTEGRKVLGTLVRIMNGRSLSMEEKRDLRDTVIVPFLTYASETCTWNESQRSKVQAVKMSYLTTEN